MPHGARGSAAAVWRGAVHRDHCLSYTHPPDLTQPYISGNHNTLSVLQTHTSPDESITLFRFQIDFVESLITFFDEMMLHHDVKKIN